jgi:DNA-binding transcriptional regulator YiaG
MPTRSDFITRPLDPDDAQTLTNQGVQEIQGAARGRSPSYSVRDLRTEALRKTRTNCAWGMTRPEIERVKGAMVFLRRLRVPCWWVVLGDELLDMPEAEAREIFRDATSYLVQAQDRAGLPQYWLRVLESQGGLHSNIVFPATLEIVDRFKTGKFGRFAQGNGVQPIGRAAKDWNEVGNYLVKERTPQADRAVGHRLGARLKGSHRLGDGGGDRVHLSTALRKDVLSAGAIEAYQRTKSKALTLAARGIINPRPEPAKAEAMAPQAPMAVMPSAEIVQLPLFPDLPKSQPPFSEGAEVRVIRLQLGKTQDQLATRLGISDRSHIANIERGHDRLSPPRRRLLRHIFETQRLAA